MYGCWQFRFTIREVKNCSNLYNSSTAMNLMLPWSHHSCSIECTSKVFRLQQAIKITIPTYAYVCMMYVSIFSRSSSFLTFSVQRILSSPRRTTLLLLCHFFIFHPDSKKKNCDYWVFSRCSLLMFHTNNSFNIVIMSTFCFRTDIKFYCFSIELYF